MALESHPPRSFSKKSWHFMHPFVWNLEYRCVLKLLSSARAEILQANNTTKNMLIFISVPLLTTLLIIFSEQKTMIFMKPNEYEFN